MTGADVLTSKQVGGLRGSQGGSVLHSLIRSLAHVYIGDFTCSPHSPTTAV